MHFCDTYILIYEVLPNVLVYLFSEEVKILYLQCCMSMCCLVIVYIHVATTTVLQYYPTTNQHATRQKPCSRISYLKPPSARLSR